MFTGLITDIGQVQAAKGGSIDIACSYDLGDDAIGASIACDGCCLTVTGTEPGPDGFKSIFSVDVSNETREHTTLGSWTPGRKINLERSLTPSSELGGHIVTGHVDSAARIVERRKDGESVRFTIEVDENLRRFIAPKGSVALNGVSLTVNEVEGHQFGINLIPHTLEATNWGDLSVGDEINLEVDLLARYVARITQSEN
jgi:riboflavin synthase